MKSKIIRVFCVLIVLLNISCGKKSQKDLAKENLFLFEGAVEVLKTGTVNIGKCGENDNCLFELNLSDVKKIAVKNTNYEELDRLWEPKW